jgi:signal transduction histidine kinase
MLKSAGGLKQKRYWIFYILVGYMIAVFFWWWFLLFRKSQELNFEKVQILYYRYQQEESSELMQEYEALMSEYERQRWMLVGEGVTFILLIVLGVYRLQSTIRKEIDLAHLQRNFLLSITHELKSPLASAKLNLQTLGKRNLSAEQQQMLVKNSEEDVARLNELVEKILLSAKMDDRQVRAAEEEFDFSFMMEEAIALAKRRWNTTEIEANIQEGVWIIGDEILLESMLMNLLENAVKYSPSGKNITATLKMNHQEAVIAVTDFGKSIPEEEKDKIFERFYRIGSEEIRTTTGVGLGLYIVKQVVLLHDGSISIVDNENGSKSFVVKIPLALKQEA